MVQDITAMVLELAMDQDMVLECMDQDMGAPECMAGECMDQDMVRECTVEECMETVWA